ncbi:hypothetical protein PAT3040_01714 [Paenibacillus agaridevorans]|uniref:CBM6 domain-containing protein n=1 Tax=Paenibacillus agaridevorans TaxID=171404 RepID=A0A2R5EKK6_9BACL|nr:carbohydrate-binding protein [Paenibacillus agaridevorans]GBG07166.1 hypothetical protein PAT3040_01714 [Paenibacillus agaridevorans]
MLRGITLVGSHTGSNDDGDWVVYKKVDLGSAYRLFTANVAVPAAFAGKTAEIRLGNVTGTLASILTVQNTGGFFNFTQQTATLTGASGVHDIYIVFKGRLGVGNFDWIKCYIF